MIGWLIATAILLLFAIVLFSRVRFFAEAAKDGDFRLQCKFCFFSLFELPNLESAEEKTNINSKPTAKNRSIEALNIKIKSYDDVISILHTVKNILIKFRKLIKRIVVKNTEFRLIVVGNEAADTALKYGAVCSAAYPVLTLMSECVTFKPDSIDISAGFDKKEMDFHLKTNFSVRIIYLLIFAVSSIKEYIKLKKELEYNG